MKRFLYLTLTLLMVAGGILLIEPRTRPVALNSHHQELVAEVTKGIERQLTYRQDFSHRVLNFGGRGIQAHYEAQVESYLRLAERPMEQSEDLRGKIIEPFLKSLQSSGIPQNERSQILAQLGKHYYDEAMIWRDDQHLAENKFTKIRLLKLAVAHLDASKGI